LGHGVTQPKPPTQKPPSTTQTVPAAQAQLPLVAERLPQMGAAVSARTQHWHAVPEASQGTDAACAHWFLA